MVNGAGGEQVPLVWALIRTLGLLLAHPLILERVLKQKLQESGQPDSRKVASKEGEEEQDAPLPYQVVSTTLDALTRQQGYADLNSSFKMLALFKIIEETTKLGEKLLVFTQSIPSLDFIEKICRQKKLPYKRLDGKTEVNKRQAQVKAFNDEGNGQVYLISTTAGGVGLNIYGASRVVIFDFQHSPVHEQQAIGRAYRIGQTKPVVVYWLICDGTFEKTLHNQQVFKNQLASSVVDKKNPLPKATSLRQYFTEPQQVEHQDTATYLGKDTILDSLLLSDEIREGISSISTTETFEEEDTQKLEADEIALAEQLVQQQIFRRNNPAEENPILTQPLEQVRDIPSLFHTSSVDSVAAFPPAFPHYTPATDPNSASSAAPLLGQITTRAGSLPVFPLESESVGGQHRTISLPPDANSLTQVVSSFPGPYLPPEFMGSHHYHLHQPGVVAPDRFAGVRTNDDPFIDPGPSTQQLGAAGPQSVARAAAESPAPQVMVPMTVGGMQKRPDSGIIPSRESMMPIGMAAMSSRPTASGMGDFQAELTRLASYPLKKQVPALVERINKHIKGGGLVRNSTWTKLKTLVRGRQDRVDAILDGRVSAQDLATADDPKAKAGLENLLDGRSSVPPQSRDNKRMKDPDVGSPL